MVSLIHADLAATKLEDDSNGESLLKVILNQERMRISIHHNHIWSILPLKCQKAMTHVSNKLQHLPGMAHGFNNPMHTFHPDDRFDNAEEATNQATTELVVMFTQTCCSKKKNAHLMYIFGDKRGMLDLGAAMKTGQYITLLYWPIIARYKGQCFDK
jgi:hypothetical protein